MGIWDAWSNHAVAHVPKVTIYEDDIIIECNVPLRREMQSGFQDIRFVDGDGVTALDQQLIEIREINGVSTARWFVKISTETNGKDIFMFYGNDDVEIKNDNVAYEYWGDIDGNSFTPFSGTTAITFNSGVNSTWHSIVIMKLIVNDWQKPRTYGMGNYTLLPMLLCKVRSRRFPLLPLWLCCRRFKC
jgi:hypothetical protein